MLLVSRHWPALTGVTRRQRSLFHVLHSLSLRIDNALTKLAFMQMTCVEARNGAPDAALRERIFELCRPAPFCFSG